MKLSYSKEESMRKGARSDVGRRREQNEDNYFLFSSPYMCYAIVADGMGGHQAGEIASSMAINEIRKYISHNVTGKPDAAELKKILEQAFKSANAAIYEHASGRFSIMGMGTTTTMALICGRSLITAHVGDSRAYKISEKGIEQLTVDHSYVNELIIRGLITPEQAKHHPKRNYITRAMGTEPDIKVDTAEYRYNGETILLCSDGLTNLVEDEEILRIVKTERKLETAAKKLIRTANERGGTDNITAVLFDERVSEVTRG